MLTKKEIKQIEINVDWLCNQLDYYKAKGIQEKVDSISNRILHELSKLDENEVQVSTESLMQ